MEVVNWFLNITRSWSLNGVVLRILSKVGGSIVPRLIDNTRRHLERNLSAAQRDQLFMKEMKNDAEFRKDLLQIVRESNDCFSNSVKEISKSMSDLSKGLCASVDYFPGL